MPRFQPYQRREEVKPIKYFAVDAPKVNHIISELMFSAEYHNRARMTQAYVLPQEIVRNTPHPCYPAHVARAWTIVPALSRQLGVDLPDFVETLGPGCKAKLTPMLYLVEHWENSGDDGHTDYSLYGYVLITEQDFIDMVDENLILVRPIRWG